MEAELMSKGASSFCARSALSAQICRIPVSQLPSSDVGEEQIGRAITA